MRAIRLIAENVPNPTSLILSPFLRALVIESKKVSMNCLASFSVISADVATVLTSSFFVISISPWKDFKICY